MPYTPLTALAHWIVSEVDSISGSWVTPAQHFIARHSCLLSHHFIYLLFTSYWQLGKFQWKLFLSTGEELFDWGGIQRRTANLVLNFTLGEFRKFPIQVHKTGERNKSCSSSRTHYSQESHLPPEFRNRFPLRTTGYLSASLLSGQISPSAANTTLWLVSWNFFNSSSGLPAKITS